MCPLRYVKSDSLLRSFPSAPAELMLRLAAAMDCAKTGAASTTFSKESLKGIYFQQSLFEIFLYIFCYL